MHWRSPWISLVALTFLLSEGAPLALGHTFNYRRKITIEADYVAGTSGSLTDFPVLINITSDNNLRTAANGGHVQDAEGDDIIFRDSTGRVQLDHEIETYVASTGQLIAWVRIPTLSKSTDTDIYIYYGNDDITTSLENVGGVWDSYYKGVWHLKEETAGTGTTDLYKDSSGNANHGDDYISDTGRSGQIGYGKTFDASDDYVTIPDHDDLDVGNTFTISAWVNTATGVRQGIASKFTNGGSYPGYAMSIKGGGSGTGLPALWTDGNFGGNWQRASTRVDDDASAWNHVAVSVSSGSVTFYTDGASDGTTTASATANAEALLLGREHAGYTFNGSIDEIRISKGIARTGDWIQTCYNNQKNPSTFYSIGDEEGPGAPTAVTLMGLTATWRGSSILIEWETSSEIDTLGFQISRSSSARGPFARITGSMVPGHLASLRSQRYRYEDVNVLRGRPHCYKLESIDLLGESTLYGPVCAQGSGEPWFIRGDADGDGLLGMGDIVRSLRYQMALDPQPPCLKAADSNDDGRIDWADPIFSANHLFAGGSAPPPPSPSCGPDPTVDELPCEVHLPCDQSRAAK